MPEFVAEFPKVEHATRFFEVMQGPANWAKNVVQKGRKVSWDKDVPEGQDDGFYFQDQLERVGYYGSSQNRKAKLNGVPAPMSY